MQYANIDVVDSEDKKLTVNKKDYLVPGDLPFKFMINVIKWSKVFEKDPSNIEGMEKFANAIYKILKIRQPDLKEDTVTGWGLNKLVSIYSFIIGGITPEETLKTIQSKKVDVKVDVKKKAE